MKFYYSIFLLVTLTKVYSQDLSQKTEYDSLVTVIRNITATAKNLELPKAIDSDRLVTKGIYGQYLVDTLNKELFSATLYSYSGHLKVLTSYFFLKEKLVRVDVYTVPVKNQTFKNIRHERLCIYWNDTLIYSENMSKKILKPEVDLLKSKEILVRFEKKYSEGKLNFDIY